ncbi:hypothetical protein [uncultured Modestobacter sp.]|uniref:hypothetical protein n=1 Tax=uncultured Modestobacter sp. TaxID=380048 RepID=UPI00261F40C8|nr:hypothetical protein [uncultured Modestobacter sp.]
MRPFLLLLLVLLVLWIAVSVIGFIVEGLFWLAVVGLLFAAGTAALAIARRR